MLIIVEQMIRGLEKVELRLTASTDLIRTVSCAFDDSIAEIARAPETEENADAALAWVKEYYLRLDATVKVIAMSLVDNLDDMGGMSRMLQYDRRVRDDVERAIASGE